MKLKRVWQRFAERLRFNTLLVIVLLATNIGFAQERRHVLKDEMESALAAWTESLTDADVPCKTKLVQVTPKQLKPIVELGFWQRVYASETHPPCSLSCLAKKVSAESNFLQGTRRRLC